MRKRRKNRAGEERGDVRRVLSRVSMTARFVSSSFLLFIFLESLLLLLFFLFLFFYFFFFLFSFDFLSSAYTTENLILFESDRWTVLMGIFKLSSVALCYIVYLCYCQFSPSNVWCQTIGWMNSKVFFRLSLPFIFTRASLENFVWNAKIKLAERLRSYKDTQ